MNIRQFAESDTNDVVALWQDCDLTRPWNDPHQDIARKLLVQPELFLVGEIDGQLVASVMAGYDGHRGSVYYLAVHPTQQGRGLGGMLMRDVESRLLAMGCPKLNLDVRSGNTSVLGFYNHLGYTHDDVASLAKRLILDNCDKQHS